MPWLKIDDNFPENTKVSELHDRAFRLHVIALCYCARNLTDGRLNARAIKVVQAVLGSGSTRWIHDLIGAGLWVNRGRGTYEIKDYLVYNPSADKVKENKDDLSRKRSEAGKKGADARWHPDSKTGGKLPLAKPWQTENGPVPSLPVITSKAFGSDIAKTIDDSLREASS